MDIKELTAKIKEIKADNYPNVRITKLINAFRPNGATYLKIDVVCEFNIDSMMLKSGKLSKYFIDAVYSDKFDEIRVEGSESEHEARMRDLRESECARS